VGDVALVFSTLGRGQLIVVLVAALSILKSIVTNSTWSHCDQLSFLMCKLMFKKHNFNTTSDMMNFFEFVDVSALQLIKNNELENTRRLRHLEPLGRAEEHVSADGKLHISETHSLSLIA
jgi:hypothetical protein